MNDLNFLPAVAMAERIRKKEISPVELVDAHLEQIEKLNPELNAYIQIDSERARQAARDADSVVMSGDTLGALHGVPISIKSSFGVEGLRCEAGTKLRAGLVARQDAVLVTRLKKAGAIILGTTNTPELLMAWETDNVLYGRTNSPWDKERTPGGSSGGEAAAIAAGMSAGGLGSDGGGSIRVPAHFSGICGLKPTPGRIPATGHFPVSAGPFASIGVVGPMARTVADLKVLFEVTQGPDIGDTNSAPVPLRWPNEDQVRALRIGYFEDDGRTPVTPETRLAVRKAAEALRAAGFQVEPFRPDGLEEARQLWWKYFVVAGGMLLRPMFNGRESDLSPILKQFLDWAAADPPHTGRSLLDAWIRRDAVRAQFFAQMQEYPILLCPAAAIPAFRHGERSWRIDGKTVKYLDAWSYTEFFNLLGNPAAVVPVSHSPEGLPIGVQVVGRPWEEEQVLAVAAALEYECGGWRIPPITKAMKYPLARLNLRTQWHR
jgi:Asp-tRNA(Asn)/Glu-tRNA(Gln) amidotransferase A subunit family amidase